MSPASIIVVGFDAADPDILVQMAADGRLPTVAALLEEGAHAETQSPVGFFVGAVWPSFSTALTPARHGRHAPRQLVPGTYEVRPTRPEDIGGRPFWAALSERGRRVAVVDVPHDSVAEGRAEVQVVEWGAHDSAVGFSTWPPLLARELVARFGHHRVHGPGRSCDGERSPADLVTLRDDLLADIEAKANLSRFLLDDDWDLFVTVFCESQCAVHQCWHLHDVDHPQHDARARDLAGDVIEDVYVAFDAALRGLVEDAGSDATIVLLASHGAKSHFDGTFLLDRILRRLETEQLSRRERWSRRLAERRWSRMSEAAQWQHPRAHDRVWRGFEELVPLDPASRRWFKVDNNEPHGGIRINLVDREPSGLVRPSELDAVCARLTADLLDITNLETGRPLVRRVLRTSDEYEGDRLAQLPDLLVEWDWTSPVRSIASPKIGRIDGRYAWTRTGDHRPEGLLVVRGAGVQPGSLPPVQITDIGPTVAARLGCTLDGVDGRPVDALLTRSPTE